MNRQLSASVMQEIINTVSERTGITAPQIYGPTRTRGVARARQMVMYVAHKMGYSMPEIGKQLNRDHTTVLHGTKVISELIGETDFPAGDPESRSAYGVGNGPI